MSKTNQYHGTVLLVVFTVLIGSIKAYLLPEYSATGAVVSNGKPCAAFGKRALARGGTFADAAITMLVCEGATGPQSMGIGGGFLATMYIKKTGEIITLNARESAPGKSTTMMFEHFEKIKGGPAVATPGEVKGYWELHKRFGKLPWADLFYPTIKLCQSGIRVDEFLARILQEHRAIVTGNPTLREIYMNKTRNDVHLEGDVYFRPKFVDTLKKIAKNGAKTIYSRGGVVGRKLVADVNSLGGNLTIEDLIDYRAFWEEPIINKLSSQYTLYTMPVPGSGSILSYILNLIKNNITSVDTDTKNWHLIAEGFKHGYGYRSQLADVHFNPDVKDMVNTIVNSHYAKSIFLTKFNENHTFKSSDHYGGKFDISDHGTANLAVLAPNGDAITVTSTINYVFGAGVVSSNTGIILNDEMDDFSTPGIKNSYGFEPSPSNYIYPRKRPVSSMCPSIILDNSGSVRLLIGAAGGSQITTSVALAIIQHLYFKKPLYQAIQSPRLHHQLEPNFLQYEKNFHPNVLQNLNETLQHAIVERNITKGFSAVTGISVVDGNVHAVFDERRGGSNATIKSVDKSIVGRGFQPFTNFHKKVTDKNKINKRIRTIYQS